jgi:hypothetical protein
MKAARQQRDYWDTRVLTAFPGLNLSIDLVAAQGSGDASNR